MKKIKRFEEWQAECFDRFADAGEPKVITASEYYAFVKGVANLEEELEAEREARKKLEKRVEELEEVIRTVTTAKI